jgi:hypothetical protein
MDTASAAASASAATATARGGAIPDAIDTEGGPADDPARGPRATETERIDDWEML